MRDYSKLYGALSNIRFRFYHLLTAESTTAVGRNVVKHQAREINRLMTGNYNVDFPLYETISEAMKDGGFSEKEAKLIALHGPHFEGKFQSPCVIYADTDSVDGSTIVDIDGIRRPIEKHFEELLREASHVTLPNDTQLVFLNGLYESPCIGDQDWDYQPVNLLYRHKTNKRRFRITTSSGKSIIVTEDHSLIIVTEEGLKSISPLNLKLGDVVIEAYSGVGV